MEVAGEAIASEIRLPKRKRTKRLMGQSPLASPIISSSTDPNFSPACSSDVTRGDDTNDEEDMAHCLMLLARGRLQLSMEQDDDEDDHINKLSSKRFLETTGEYVYQCKTCDKSFPSFQALGGHRASHKKPRITPPAPAMAKDNKHQLSLLSPALSSGDHGDVLSLPFIDTASKNSSCASIKINSRKRLAKVHECSICGAEFSSGQALGGHMRRHRAIMTSQVPASTTVLLNPKTPESEEPLRLRSCTKAPFLELDLNLPAPEDDDPEPGFPVHSTGQKQKGRPSLVFSFPALVNCRY